MVKLKRIVVFCIQWWLLFAFLGTVAYLAMTGQTPAYDANGNPVHVDKSILMRM